MYICNISEDFRTSTANNATPDNSSPATPIHIGNLHLHIQRGDVYLHGSKCSSVHLHDGNAVAKGRNTPSPFFVTCGGHKVKSTTMGLTNSQQCSKGGSVYIGHPIDGGFFASTSKPQGKCQLRLSSPPIERHAVTTKARANRFAQIKTIDHSRSNPTPQSHQRRTARPESWASLAKRHTH